MATPIRLNELTPSSAGEILTASGRIIVPVGTMVPQAAHLPLGTDTIILDRLADELSARLGLPRAPVIPFGVHGGGDPEGPGMASLTRKTLHRVMNELIACWENQAKIRHVTILTLHAADPHQEALSTIRTVGTVTLIDVYSVPELGLLTHEALDTALIMHLEPNLIDRNTLPPHLGASPDAGSRIFNRIVDHVAGSLVPA
jgi:creatinine amidohydrolase